MTLSLQEALAREKMLEDKLITVKSMISKNIGNYNDIMMGKVHFWLEYISNSICTFCLSWPANFHLKITERAETIQVALVDFRSILSEK